MNGLISLVQKVSLDESDNYFENEVRNASKLVKSAKVSHNDPNYYDDYDRLIKSIEEHPRVLSQFHFNMLQEATTKFAERDVKKSLLYTLHNYLQALLTFTETPESFSFLNMPEKGEAGMLWASTISIQDLIKATALIEYAKRLIIHAMYYLEIKEIELLAFNDVTQAYNLFFEEFGYLKTACDAWLLTCPISIIHWNRDKNELERPKDWFNVIFRIYCAEHIFPVYNQFIKLVIKNKVNHPMQEVLNGVKKYCEDYRKDLDNPFPFRAQAWYIENRYWPDNPNNGPTPVNDTIMQ